MTHNTKNILKDFLLMNIFTSLFLPILLATTMHSISMEQPLDLGEVVRTCPNQIVSHLDGKTLLALTNVSQLNMTK